MDVTNFVLYDCGVCVIWKWNWGEDVYEVPDSSFSVQHASDQSPRQESPVPSSESEDEPVIDRSIIHAVVFKCIGSNKDSNSQEVLCQVAQRRENGDVVKVKLRPQPTNPVDSRAIAFVCYHNGVWQRIGYVVKECTDTVHSALAHNLIVTVKFSWVKYILHWSWSGPGWYAGIKMGSWPAVVRAVSTI